jgi:putative endopeptidase
MKRTLTFAITALLLTAASPSSPPVSPADQYLAQFVAPSVSPRDDFFRYAVDKWLKDHPIPANERSWGISHVVQEETYRRVVAINEESAANTQAAKGSNAQKIGDFWYAAMDTVTILKQGFTPLAEEFARIDAVKDRAGMLDEVARLGYIGVGAMCSFAIFQDEMNSDRYALHLYQGGLGLPDRDYYFDQDERAKMLRREYVDHVGRMFQL